MTKKQIILVLAVAILVYSLYYILNTTPASILKKYYKTNSLDEKIQYIDDLENLDCIRKFITNIKCDINILNIEYIYNNNEKWAMITFNYGLYDYVHYLVKRKNRYRINIENSYGFNKISAVEFFNLQPKTDVLLKCKMVLSDYYDYEYKNKENIYYSLEIYDPLRVEFIGNGYIEKNSIAGQKLYNIVRNRAPHRIAANFKFSNNSIGGRVFSISSISNYNGYFVGE